MRKKTTKKVVKKVVKKAVKKPVVKMLSIRVGRLDNNKAMKVPVGTTVDQALTKGKYKVSSNEAIQDTKSNVLNGSEEVTNKTGYYIIQRVKNR